MEVGAIAPAVAVSIIVTAMQGSREVIRCHNRHCQLMQYMTLDRLCRKCHLSLDPPPPPQPLPPQNPHSEKPGAPLHRGRAVIGDGRHDNEFNASDLNAELRVAAANVLRIFRQSAGFSQRTLGLKIDVSRTYLTKIEAATLLPRIDYYEKFADAVGVPTEFVVDCIQALASGQINHSGETTL